MASAGTLKTARGILLALEAGQSQGSIASQAADCIPIVEALGYYDLADHLKDLTFPEEPPSHPLEPFFEPEPAGGEWVRDLDGDHWQHRVRGWWLWLPRMGWAADPCRRLSWRQMQDFGPFYAAADPR